MSAVTAVGRIDQRRRPSACLASIGVRHHVPRVAVQASRDTASVSGLLGPLPCLQRSAFCVFLGFAHRPFFSSCLGRSLSLRLSSHSAVLSRSTVRPARPWMLGPLALRSGAR